MSRPLIAAALCALVGVTAAGQSKPRARDLGIPFEGTPGALNAITDVAGVEVGMTTLISGDAVRTGVTAVLPRGKAYADPVFAAWFPLNGEPRRPQPAQDCGRARGGETMTGTGRTTIPAIPHGRVKEILAAYGYPRR